MDSDDGLLVVSYSDEAYGGLLDMAMGAENRHIRGNIPGATLSGPVTSPHPFLAACGLWGVRGLPGNRGLRGLLHLPSAAAP